MTVHEAMKIARMTDAELRCWAISVFAVPADYSPQSLRAEALTTLADAYEQQQRDLAEAARLLREGQDSILEHQWAVRMLTESATPEALSLGKLKTKGDNVWSRMKAFTEKHGEKR